MVKLNNRKPQEHDSRKSFEAPWTGQRSTVTPPAPPEQPVDGQAEADENFPPSLARLPARSKVLEAWEGFRNLGRRVFEAAVREVVTLFRRRNGAPPPGQRVAVFMILVLFVYDRYRRPREPTLPPSSREIRTPRRNSVPPQQESLPRSNLDRDRGLRSSAVAVAVAATSGLSSPSRSLFSATRQALGSPTRSGVDSTPSDDIDPSLPSPAQARAAQARAAQARTEQARTARIQGWRRQGRTEREAEGGWYGRWRWRLRGWRRSGELRSAVGDGGRRDRRRRCLPWLVLLWLVASVLEVVFELHRLWLRLKCGVFTAKAADDVCLLFSFNFALPNICRPQRGSLQGVGQTQLSYKRLN